MRTANTLVILGTGGTIAGTAADPLDNVGYTAAQRTVAQLVAAVPALAAQPLEAEQLAQLDSKDMDGATWARLAQRIAQQLVRPEVAAVLVTHGTDTLEETAWLLHQVLRPAKPVVLTAAMRPATALQADGPQNLLDAATTARAMAAAARAGVVVVMAGQVHAAERVRKRHSYRLDAMGSGDAGPLAVVEESALRPLSAWPALPQTRPLLGPGQLPTDAAAWPWVEIVTSHAGARPEGILALLAAGVRGLVLAGTGNGTVHRAMQPALDEARQRGVPVWLCTRCADGVVLGAAAGPAAGWSPWQARVALQLALLAGPVQA